MLTEGAWWTHGLGSLIPKPKIVNFRMGPR
jgi:hypothetical protein